MSALGLITVYFVVVMSLITAASDWLNSKTVAVREGQILPDFRLWLRVRDDYGHSAMYIKLPSYDWRQDVTTLRWGWHRRVLVHLRGQWRIEFWPENE